MYKRRATKRKASKPKKTAKLSKPMRRAIKQVVQGESETKRATFYQTAMMGPVLRLLPVSMLIVDGLYRTTQLQTTQLIYYNSFLTLPKVRMIGSVSAIGSAQ